VGVLLFLILDKQDPSFATENGKNATK